MKKISTLIGEMQNKSRPKNISREFQFYGCEVCEALDDTKKYSLYIKLAKNTSRGMMEEALNFVKDYPGAKSKAKLFMWKLKQLKESVVIASPVDIGRSNLAQSRSPLVHRTVRHRDDNQNQKE